MVKIISDLLTATISPNFLTAMLTLVGGIVIFVLQKLVIISLIEPYQEFKEAKSKIKYFLRMNRGLYVKHKYASNLHNNPAIQKFHNELKKIGEELIVKYENLNILTRIFFCKSIPQSKIMDNIYTNLIRISNDQIFHLATKTSEPYKEVNDKIEEILSKLK